MSVLPGRHFGCIKGSEPGFSGGHNPVQVVQGGQFWKCREAVFKLAVSNESRSQWQYLLSVVETTVFSVDRILVSISTLALTNLFS